MFSKISLNGWRQFRHIDINFHPRLTILTGANGAGKTTILSLISRHLGWGNQYIATPTRRIPNSSTMQYSADLWKVSDLLYEIAAKENFQFNQDEFDKMSDSERLEYYTILKIEQNEIRNRLELAHRQAGPTMPIGTIRYISGTESQILVQTNGNHVYDIQIPNQQHVEGVHIPSHRTTASYQMVQNIPTVPRRRSDVFNNYVNIVRSRFMGSHTQWSPQYYMKETLIALATFGYGNSAVEPDIESANIFEEFQEILKKCYQGLLDFKN